MLFLLSLWLPATVVAATASWRCSGHIVVDVADTILRDRLCATLVESERFLTTLGLPLTETVTLRLTGQLPAPTNVHAIAQYDIRRHEILLLDPVTIAAQGDRQGLIDPRIDETVWLSFAAHELAHAAAEPRFAASVRRFAASEYVAAVTQLAVLPAVQREALLATDPRIRAFSGKNDITSTYYFLDPGRFALKSWLHYQDAGPAFVRHLLAHGLPDR